MPANRSTPARLKELAESGVSARRAYELLKQETGYRRRRQDFLREFAAAAGRPQQVEQRAERAVKALEERLKQEGLELTPERAAATRARERARYTPKKYRPPEWAVDKRPVTFAEGKRYSYRFRAEGVNKRTGRRESRWVSLLTDELVPISSAAEDLKRMIRDYGIRNLRLVFDLVVESAK